MIRFSSIKPRSESFWGRFQNRDDTEKQFEQAVAASKMHLWAPNDPISNNVYKRLLIGVATWSMHDMKLMDEVNGRLVKLEQGGITNIRVDVFNYDSIKDQQQASRYFPNVLVIVTPIVGLWIWGVHQHTRIGNELALETLSNT